MRTPILDGPINPVAVAEIIRGKSVSKKENAEDVVKAVLGRNWHDLVNDKRSVLFRPISEILKLSWKPTPEMLQEAALFRLKSYKSSGSVDDKFHPAKTSNKSIDGKAVLDPVAAAAEYVMSLIDGCYAVRGHSEIIEAELLRRGLANQSNVKDIIRQVAERCATAEQVRLSSAEAAYRNICESRWKVRWFLESVGYQASDRRVGPIMSQQAYARCDGSNPLGWNGFTQIPCHPDGGYGSEAYTTCDVPSGTRIPTGQRFPWLVNGSLNVSSASVLDPMQRTVADCGLVAALASLAWTHPNRLISAIRDLGPGENGTRQYAVRLYGNDYIIDDSVPMSPYAFYPLGCDNYSYAVSWPAVFEKAFATRITRDRTGRPFYGALSGFDSNVAISGIIGGNHFGESIRSRSLDEAWRSLTSICSSTGKTLYPTTCGVGVWPDDVAPQASYFSSSGVIGGHAYSLLGTGIFNGRRGVVIRNPWGFGLPNPSVLISEPRADSSIELNNVIAESLSRSRQIYDYGSCGVFVIDFTQFYSLFGWWTGVRI